MKVLKRLLLILLAIVLSAVCIAFLAWSVLHVAKYFIYPDYYQKGEIVSPIPDLNGGFRPKGVFYDEESGSYLHSGSKGEFAALYVVDKDGDAKELIPVYNSKDTQSIGRGGAVVRAGDYVYICDNENQNNSINGILFVFSYEEIMNAKDGATVRALARYDTDCAMSAMFVDDHYLYVGEYYSEGTNYSTHKTHHYTTPEGKSQKAMLFAYKLNSDGSIAQFPPAFAISLPDQVTGFALKNGVFMLTRGEDWKYSSLEFYNTWSATGDTVKVSNGSVPIYYFPADSLTQTVKLPLCAGNLTLVEGDRVAITFEFASNYFIIGKFFFAYNVVSYPIPHK